MTSHKLTIMLLCVLTALAQFEIGAQNRRWLSYEPATVELEGRLISEWKYGPPNFGEDPKRDQRVKVPILVLTTRVNVRANPADATNAVAVRNVRRIQLVLSDVGYRELMGRDVVVKGSLFHSFTGHHYTDVLMDVRSIHRKSAR